MTLIGKLCNAESESESENVIRYIYNEASVII